MNKLLFVMSVISLILTFIGAGYVFLSDGDTNAGYAVVPMVFTLIFILGYRRSKPIT